MKAKNSSFFVLVLEEFWTEKTMHDLDFRIKHFEIESF